MDGTRQLEAERAVQELVISRRVLLGTLTPALLAPSSVVAQQRVSLPRVMC